MAKIKKLPYKVKVGEQVRINDQWFTDNAGYLYDMQKDKVYTVLSRYAHNEIRLNNGTRDLYFSAKSYTRLSKKPIVMILM